MYVSTVRTYAGLESKKDSPECIEVVSVYEFAVLDDAEGGFERRLKPSE
mgnify:CR=1 FL=1